ncbi:MAG: nucleotide exchange factor GrpE [Bdellovibrionales bacterium]|nr:nucleotide exchange factor GrpE [Bdellovibrionales bacterium]
MSENSNRDSQEAEDQNHAESSAKDPASTQEQNMDPRSELEKAKSDFLYLRAEFDNYRKNAIRERSEMLKYGGERLARELLDVLDTFDLATQSEVTPENLESFVTGIDLTKSNLKNLLSRFGVHEVSSLGEAFDPTVHEALGSEATDEIEAGHISKVFKKAYKLHDRLLRPAQVMVAKPTDSSQEGD